MYAKKMQDCLKIRQSSHAVQNLNLYKIIAKFPCYAKAGWHKVREPGSLIAKDIIDSEDPKHMLFCRETAFVAIYTLFQGQYSHPLIEIQIYLPYR